MLEFLELKQLLSNHLTEQQLLVVENAFRCAEAAHEGQFRHSGEPYISHPLEVARILAHLQMDYEGIAAALMHDVLEDTALSEQQIEQQFGATIAHLVEGVSKLDKIAFSTQLEAKAENLRKMMFAMSRDIRVILIKLADRLHNMRTLNALPDHKKRRIALETLEIYAPIAHRLGMNHFRVEFEDLAFQMLHPVRYKILKEALRKLRGNRREILATIESRISHAITEQAFSVGAIWGREKHLWSIYRKMREKRVSFSEVMDVYAFRIIVDTDTQCYQVLGILHHLYKPIHGRFKDYIAIPKANGYRSLHSTVIGPYGVPIEVQIRTKQMDQIAEHGVAAHWVYKNIEELSDRTEVMRAQEWLENLVEVGKNTESSEDFLESLKIDLYPDTVYVFTPRGQIKALPKNATPIDFAYAIHTDIGNTCVAAKIDRRLVPLSMPIDSGQTVEIITAPYANPHANWLQFVVTSKARNAIRTWLRSEEQVHFAVLGERLLKKAFLSHGLDWDTVAAKHWKALYHVLGVNDQHDLFQDIGKGNRLPLLVLSQMLQVMGSKSKIKRPSASLEIEGTEGFVVSFPSCCYPIRDDDIIGILQPEVGLIVHQAQCAKVQHYSNREHLIPIHWGVPVKGKEYAVALKVDAINRRGVLADMTMTLSDNGCNIINVVIDERDNRHNTITFVISVHDRNHLAELIRKMKMVRHVSRVRRLKAEG